MASSLLVDALSDFFRSMGQNQYKSLTIFGKQINIPNIDYDILVRDINFVYTYLEPLMDSFLWPDVFSSILYMMHNRPDAESMKVLLEIYQKYPHARPITLLSLGYLFRGTRTKYILPKTIVKIVSDENIELKIMAIFAIGMIYEGSNNLDAVDAILRLYDTRWNIMKIMSIIAIISILNDVRTIIDILEANNLSPISTKTRMDIYSLVCLIKIAGISDITRFLLGLFNSGSKVVSTFIYENLDKKINTFLRLNLMLNIAKQIIGNFKINEAPRHQFSTPGSRGIPINTKIIVVGSEAEKEEMISCLAKESFLSNAGHYTMRNKLTIYLYRCSLGSKLYVFDLKLVILDIHEGREGDILFMCIGRKAWLHWLVYSPNNEMSLARVFDYLSNISADNTYGVIIIGYSRYIPKNATVLSKEIVDIFLGILKLIRNIDGYGIMLCPEKIRNLLEISNGIILRVVMKKINNKKRNYCILR